MKLLNILNLRRISGQIAALVLVSIVAIHAIIGVSFNMLRGEQPPLPDRGHGELVAIAKLLSGTPVAERPTLLERMKAEFPGFDLRDETGDFVASADANRRGEEFSFRHLTRMLGFNYRVIPLPDNRIGLVLPDGQKVSVSDMPERRPPRPFWGNPVILTFMFAVFTLSLLGLWAARMLAAPLSSFAKTAEEFSLSGTSTPLPEIGPEEIRSVARALNRMRERIGALIDDRTKMLAAISHDLRTPITRLRLRSEFIEDEGHRRHMLRDLDQMRSMLEAVLSFLRNERRLEEMTLTDIATTVQLVADQFADIGHMVTYQGPSHAMAMARPNDLHRAVTNLVENAVKFGTEAAITLTVSERGAVIDVADDGPGISDAQKSAMLQPFVRGDDARNMDHEASGFGLGLTIARAVAVAHGGELTLHDGASRGLIARITLPAPDAGKAAN